MNPDETILPHNKILDIGANDIVVNPPKNVSTVELSLTPTQSLVPTAFQKSSQLSATELFTSSSLFVDSIMTDATSDQVLAELAVEPKPVEVKVDKFVEDDSQPQRFEEISLEDDSHRSRTPVSDSERKDKRRPKPFTIIVNKASPTSSVPSSPSSLTLKLSNEDLSSEGEGDAHEHQLNRQSSGPFYCVPITPAVSQKNLADTVKAQRSSSDDGMLQIRNQGLPTGTRSRSLTMLDSSRPDHDHEMTRTNSHSRLELVIISSCKEFLIVRSKWCSLITFRPNGKLDFSYGVRTTFTHWIFTYQKLDQDLPPKSPEEDKKHLREHEIMMRKAQRADDMRSQRENYGGKESLLDVEVWGLCIGNALAITQATYDMCLDRAFEVKSESTDGLGSPTRVDSANKMAEIFENIEKDVLTTLPALGLFQGENPLCESLRSVLEAYIFYWKDPKYV
ncbi:8860_t:CDS:2, partial [Paraglomus occultum]